MSYMNNGSLVQTEWLADHMDAPDVRIVDGTWFLPRLQRDAADEYESQHIPGAVFFDIDGIADSDSALPHMLPSPEKFSSRVRKLGLGDGNRIVVYDALGLYSAPRVWWMFRIFGHDDIAVLDGGLPKWLAEGRPVTAEPPMPRERHFTARFNTTMVRDLDQVRRALEKESAQVVDARPENRFSGAEPEPRPGLRSGHMPGSVNLPYSALVGAESGTMKSAEALRAAFEDAGVDLARPVVTSCGSGITACLVALGLDLLGHRDVAVFDGSWVEWGSRDDTPVAP